MDRARWWCVVAMLVVATGCEADDGVAPGVDAGTSDGGSLEADGGSPETDGGHGEHDGGSVPSDAAVAACDPGCGEDEACLRGVCVATCGADAEEIAGWDAALAEGLAPIANVCRPGVGPLEIVAGARVYEVSASTTGTTTTFTLSRWTLDPTVSAPAAETLATATHEGHAAGMIYPGGYVAISPDEMRAIFGYTTSDAGAVGGVFDVATGGGTATETGANGNYDAAWLDATHYVVDGLGLEGSGSEGQGLYVCDASDASTQRAVDEMGEYSGSVALVGDAVVAGAGTFATPWPDEVLGDRVFVFTRDDLLTARSAISAWDDALARFEAPSSFSVIGGGRLVSPARDESWNLLGLDARALEEGESGWTLGAPEALTTGGVFTRAEAVGEDRILLVHAGGLLLVE